MEFLKELDDNNLEEVLKLLNEWWTTESIPDEMMRAKVVLIFKQCDKKDLSNFRPTSLLNSLFKLIAAILQKRIAEQLDPPSTKNKIRVPS